MTKLSTPLGLRPVLSTSLTPASEPGMRDIISFNCKVPHLYLYAMDTNFADGLLTWIQTPLGANIIGPLVVTAVIGLFVGSHRWIRRAPRRLFRWMERRALHEETTK